MNQKKESKSAFMLIDRRKFLIRLGILLGVILAGISILKMKAIQTINRFRIRSVERTPSFDADTWKLMVDGLINTPLILSYDELLKLESEEQITDFHCVEGWSVDGVKWKGVRLRVIFDKVGLKPDAEFVTFHSASGIYTDSLSIKDALLSDVMLAYLQDDQQLPQEQGRPLRLVMPRMFGYKNVKWINRITLTKTQEVGYWEKFGYNIDGVSYP